MPLRRRGHLARQHPQRRVVPPTRPEPTAPDPPSASSPGSASDPRSKRAHEPFESLVERALDSLPARFASLLDDVAVVIEDAPTREQARLAGVEEDGWLYGLYEGIPATEWGADWATLPNKITLFRLPLEADFPDPTHLQEEVRITVIHELAHHAGIDDARLRELDFD